MIHISLPDGSKLEVAPGTSLHEVASAIGPRLAKAAVCAEVDGTLRDLREQVNEDASVTFFTRGSEEALSVLRHTTTHIMAQAVKRLFPQAQLGIGPAIEDGFYYDFGVEQPFTPEQLASIEEEMRRIIAEAYPIERLEVSKSEAEKILRDNNEPLKLELLADLEDETISMFKQGEFIDLCRGPHLASTGDVKKDAFKLLSVAGAYWRGDESRPMLQRIYGTAWESKKDLASYLEKLEQIEARDHRKLIKQLDLVSFHEEAGAGLAYWHPKGGRMRVIIEDYWRKLHYQGGYDIVFTPHIGRAHLWETSGHLNFYRDGMYAPMDIDGQDYYIKPMNCPFHIMIYKSKTRSYRDLPLRWAELGTVYRYERSGTLHGLLRVRGFTQDDAHIFCTPDQVEDEILRVLDFSLNLLRGFGFEEFKIELSVRDPNKPGKYAGEDVMWEQAEGSLIKALDTRELPYTRMEGEAVFYGPKIDIKIKDALNRTWQCSTIQFDFNLPGRFDMSYIGEDGAEHRPYMIHRALLGSLERFYGVLIEHYAGAFPVWLAPVQAMVIPISDRHNEYAQQVADTLKAADLRAEVDTSSGRMNAKIRNAQMQKIPYMLVVGDKEMEGEAVFYGPKIDIKIKDALNRTWQCSTIQFDFNLPGRFDMSYIGEDGAEHRPYMIHRALLGSLERFYGVLIEHYAGAFPVWLAPVQAMVIPISDRHNDYARQVADTLKAADLRAEVDTSSGRMNAKIRNAQMQKIPYMLVVGDKEMEAGTVAVRLRSGEDLGAMSLDDLAAMMARKVEEKALL